MNEGQSGRHQYLRRSDINRGRGVDPDTTALTLTIDGVDVWDEKHWRRLGSILRSNTNLNEIEVYMNDLNLSPGEINIGDICLDNFVSALNKNTSLRELGLYYINIGLKGCTSLAKLLKNQNLSLKDLCIHGEGGIINDECVMVLTDALGKNATLERLTLRGYINELTSTGWSSILRLVCKRSSINGVMEANHNLVFVLGDTGNYDGRVSAWDALDPFNFFLLFASLKLNESNEKLLVVRQKIYWNHTLGNLNIGDSDIPTSAVPLILAWFGTEQNLTNAFANVNRFRLDSIYRIVKSRADLMARDESKETHPEIDHLDGNKRGSD